MLQKIISIFFVLDVLAIKPLADYYGCTPSNSLPMRQNKSRMSRLFWQLRQLLQVSAYPTFCSRPWENQNKKRVGRTIWIWQSSWGWVSEWITLYIRDQSTAFGEKSTLSGEVFHWQWWIAFSPQRLTDGSHQYPIHYDVSTPIKGIANALFQTFPDDFNRFKKTKYPKYIQCWVRLNLSIRRDWKYRLSVTKSRAKFFLGLNYIKAEFQVLLTSRRQWCSKTNRQMALRYHLLKSRYS